MTLPRRLPALVVALVCGALLLPAAAPGAGAPAGAPAADATAAAKKKKAKKKCKKVVKKVNGKRRKVCKKKKARSRPKAESDAPKAPQPVPAPPTPAPPAPVAPAPVQQPAAPVDPEQYRADDVGRQLIANRDILLEHATSGAVMDYTRIYMRRDGSFKLAKSSWNMMTGETCGPVTHGTWGFNRAYKPPEGGVLLVLDITTNGTPSSDVFWVVSDTTVKVGRDFVPYSINDELGEPC